MTGSLDFYKNKRVLVTGGLGFLGSTLARRLAGLGAQVTLLDCLLEGHGGNPFNIQGLEDKARWVKGDIRDETLLQSLIPGQDVLFNIAAQTSHTDSMERPLLDADVNVRGQLQILETCRRKNPSIRAVYCSTRAVYGAGASQEGMGEDRRPEPLDVYAAHKLVAEHYHKIYASVFGLNATILRLANGYGPRAQMRQPIFGILNWFVRLALDGSEIKIFGEGRQLRDYVYIDDAVEAFLAAGARQDLKGEVLNVGSGKGVPLIEIVEALVRLAGSGRIAHVPWPETNRKIDVGDFIADVGRIERKTGWSARTSLEDGLKKTVEFYRAHKAHYW